MHRIDEDLLHRKFPNFQLRLNDRILIEQFDLVSPYCVKVWNNMACIWITHNSFNTLKEAESWASLTEPMF